MNQHAATVFIVDDDSGVRSAIRLLLRTVGIHSVPLASAQEFLDSPYPDHPGCLLLDIRMPGMSGLELQQQLNVRGAPMPLIFISGNADIPMAVEAMQRGAFDFLQKPFRDQELIDRVQRALRKDEDMRKSLQQKGRSRRRLESLTPREREVLELLVQGKQNKVMAAALDLSQRTIEIHRAHLMEKVGVQSVAELVRVVLDAREAP
ncbi:MAG: response regulator [Steroidobacteraceae bacterium]